MKGSHGTDCPSKDRIGLTFSEFLNSKPPVAWCRGMCIKLGGPVVPSAKHRLKYLIERSLNLFSFVAYTCVCWSLSRGHGGGGCLDFVLCFERLVINGGFPPPPIILSMQMIPR